MQSSHPVRPRWEYASLTVLDGPRRLKPAEAGPDFVRFRDPPRLAGGRIEIILRAAGVETRWYAAVLPHDAEATRIPIRLSPPHVDERRTVAVEFQT